MKEAANSPYYSGLSSFNKAINVDNSHKSRPDSSPFIINDEDQIIHFERFKTGHEDGDRQGSPRPRRDNSDSRAVADDIAAMLLGTVDRKIEIIREEQDGYLVQKTIITERQKLSDTARTLKNLGISPSIKDEEYEPPEPNQSSEAHPPAVYSTDSSSGKYDSLPSHHPDQEDEDPDENFHENQPGETDQGSFLRSAQRTLKKILAAIMILGILTGAGLIAWTCYTISHAPEEFQEMITSLQPVKVQVEQCLIREKIRNLKICSDGEKAQDGSWDLSHRFLSDNRHPNFSSIRIQNGIITAYANFDQIFKGVTYITRPVFDSKGNITWELSDKSGCIKSRLCSPEEQPRTSAK